MRRYLWIFWLAAVLLLSACAPLGEETTPSPGNPSQETPVVGIPGTGETQTPGDPVQAARGQLAEGLGLTLEDVRVVSQEAVEWPSACLGLELPGVMCADVIVPGERVVLEVEDQQYVYHTAGAAQQPVFAGLADDQSGDNLVLVWNRTGGIAGFCDQLRVFQGGLVQSLQCQEGAAGPGKIRLMDPVEQQQLTQWVETYGDVSIERTDPATADAMTIRLDIQGMGSEQPDEDIQEQMLDFVQILHTHLFPPQ